MRGSRTLAMIVIAVTACVVEREAEGDPGCGGSPCPSVARSVEECGRLARQRPWQRASSGSVPVHGELPSRDPFAAIAEIGAISAAAMDLGGFVLDGAVAEATPDAQVFQDCMRRRGLSWDGARWTDGRDYADGPASAVPSTGRPAPAPAVPSTRAGSTDVGPRNADGSCTYGRDVWGDCRL